MAVRSGSARGRDRFGGLRAFCLFVGYQRSGHSVVGSLLDAHPDVVLAHQANALRLAAEGLPREELFDRLLRLSAEQAAGGRRQSRYSYAVEGQWQGRFRELLVIGDKAGEKSARLVGRGEGVLDRFEAHVGLPLRLVHVVRNPFDVVARMALIRTGRERVRKWTIPAATESFARLADTVDGVIADGRHPLLTLRHEELIAEPRRELGRLCTHLGVEPEPGWLEACSAILFASPSRTRERVEWTAAERRAVEAVVARHAFLDGYGFGS